jgi:hypothetical protein
MAGADPKRAECDRESSAKVENRNLGGEDSMRGAADALRRNLELDKETEPHRPVQGRRP